MNNLSDNGQTASTAQVAAKYVINGVTVRQNQYSAKWRRMWWITDIGRSSGAFRRALIAEAGYRPDDFTQWTPTVSFPSLAIARAAISKAAEAA